MDSNKHWYLVSYDIREAKRWRRIYRVMNGYGERLQYSVFRCDLTKTQMESMRFELEKIMTDEDDLLIIRLAPQSKIIERTGKQVWKDEKPKFQIL